MSFYPMSKNSMDFEVGHFMNVGDQEWIRMKVCIDSDAGCFSGAESKVTNFSDPGFSQFKRKPVVSPKIETIFYCWRRDVIFE